jgi:precorrin-6A/cobalt-precorrin-6A reductase
MPAPRLLILGGTGEAAALARAAALRFAGRIEIVSSLAGRAEAPSPLPGAIRIGGFGGAEGLARYLADEGIALVIDATHPFAARISRHAAEATANLALPRLVLERPRWPRRDGDRWIEVDGMEAAAAALRPLGRRVWLTVGTTELGVFANLADRWFLVRLVAAAGPLPFAHYVLIEGRGPFATEDERALISRHGIEVLVAKASGGAATYGKIEAAREAGLPVVMVRRPPPAPQPRVESLQEALAWLEARIYCPDSEVRRDLEFIAPRVRRQKRLMAARMSSADFAQRKGLGSAL